MPDNAINPSASSSPALPADRPHKADMQRAHTLITAGNSLLICSVVMLLATIVIAYIIPEKVTLQIQVLSHIGTLIFATGLKFGYILRLTGQHRINQFHKQLHAAEKQRKHKNQYGLCNA